MKTLVSFYPDTIAAIATPSGSGGVGIIRISGYLVFKIAEQLLEKNLTPRYAIYTNFLDTDKTIIDSGIALYFPAPNSYTGEDVLELQGHGGRVVLDMVLRRVLQLGARVAKAGEFTERAFLNKKLDLAQAEAVADLIESSTEQSVKSAQQSLQGTFSKKIDLLVEKITQLRVYVEAAIDFVDEEIDFLHDGIIQTRLNELLTDIKSIKNTAQQGQLLRDGMTIVLAGKPNAGKSSLLNALAGYDAAIISDIEGTTRDLLRERIQLDGMPLHIIDTAGLRESNNAIEQEGIRRAQIEMQKADKILLLVDCKSPEKPDLSYLPTSTEIITVFNKIDLIGLQPSIEKNVSETRIYISIKTGQGIDLLIEFLKQSVGFKTDLENVFIARRRHLEALEKSYALVENALHCLVFSQGELVAEELRQAQQCLSEITGEFTSDDLLGKIFSSFCIGK